MCNAVPRHKVKGVSGVEFTLGFRPMHFSARLLATVSCEDRHNICGWAARFGKTALGFRHLGSGERCVPILSTCCGVYVCCPTPRELVRSVHLCFSSPLWILVAQCLELP